MPEEKKKSTLDLTGNLVRNLEHQVDRHKWVIPVGFAFTVILSAAAVILLFVRGFEGMLEPWAFSVGADIFCLFVCTMLYLSCMLARERQGNYLRTFTFLLTITATALFLDECSWLLQGLASLRVLNLIVNVFYYANGSILIYLFWRYLITALNVDDKLTRAVDITLGLLLLPNLVLCFVNFFYPLYFYVDEAGNYARGEHYPYSQIYLLLCVISVVIAMIRSRAPLRQKLVAGSFVSIPLASFVITSGTFGITTQYSSMLVSIVLIYGVLFADREKSIAATEKELSLATRIQADMLPNIFPAFPERDEFDIYASMNPAKEVGGDFYDFFLIDENHLGLVIADVSGKGVPAALFMMISKILVQNYALTGRSPAEVLEATNRQICANNREEMFVTVWFAVLDLTTGKLAAANAGHEYPILKSPDKPFELIKDKHGFVIGGMEGLTYKEYDMQLQPGAKLFLYTDGVPEATNAQNELFGVERTVAALNEDPDRTPQELLTAVDTAVAAFVAEAPQFDDLTMLCVQYNGK